ncbi:hypothetical protein STEG23_036606 [Scotinomys teguina]
MKKGRVKRDSTEPFKKQDAKELKAMNWDRIPALLQVVDANRKEINTAESFAVQVGLLTPALCLSGSHMSYWASVCIASILNDD